MTAPDALAAWHGITRASPDLAGDRHAAPPGTRRARLRALGTPPAARPRNAPRPCRGGGAMTALDALAAWHGITRASPDLAGDRHAAPPGTLRAPAPRRAAIAPGTLPALAAEAAP